MRLGFFIFILLALGPAPAGAEYRVFMLKIEKPSKDPKVPGPSRSVASTLDPEQYRGYYPVAADEVVTYTDTWRCRGRTDNQVTLCPNPRTTASTTPSTGDPKTSVQGPVSSSTQTP